MTYRPKVNDYVKWTDSLGLVTEGWVYFVCKDYFTIEIGVKDKPDDFLVISGDDDLALGVVLAGGAGVISVIGREPSQGKI